MNENNMNENNIFFVGKIRFYEYFIKPINLQINIDIKENDLFQVTLSHVQAPSSYSIDSNNSDDSLGYFGNKDKQSLLSKETLVSLKLLKNHTYITDIAIKLESFKSNFKINEDVEIPGSLELFFYILPPLKNYSDLNELNDLIKIGKRLLTGKKSTNFDTKPPEGISEEGTKKYLQENSYNNKDNLKISVKFYQSININDANSVANWDPIKNLTKKKIIEEKAVINLFNEIKAEENPLFKLDSDDIKVKMLEKIRDELEVPFAYIKEQGEKFETKMKSNKINVFVSDMKWCQDIAGYFLSSFCDKIDKVTVLPCLHEIVGRAGEFASRNDKRTNCRNDEKIANKDAMLKSQIVDMHFGSRTNMSIIDSIVNNIKKMPLNDIKKNNDLKSYYHVAETYKNYDGFEYCGHLKLENPPCTTRDKILIDWNLYLNFYKYGYRDEIYWNKQYYSQSERDFCRKNTFLGIFFNNIAYIKNIKSIQEIQEFIHDDERNKVQEYYQDPDIVGQEGGNKRNRTKKNKRKTQKRKNRKTKSKKSQKHKFSKRK